MYKKSTNDNNYNYNNLGYPPLNGELEGLKLAINLIIVLKMNYIIIRR